MCKFIGKSNEWIFCKLSKSEILRLYSIVHVAMETMKTSHFTCQSKSLISVFFTCQVSACEPQPFSCHDLANDTYSQTAKTVFSHLNRIYISGIWIPPPIPLWLPVDWSVRFPSNQHEAETSTNVNKHWKTAAEGNDVIANVIPSISISHQLLRCRYSNSRDVVPSSPSHLVLSIS